MMTERQAKILAAVIEQYAELATPVGSVLLAKLFDVSPATMRAEMKRLEEMGYLTQPHTSAGRVPTDKGYRLYVNSLVETGAIKKAAERTERQKDADKAIKAHAISGGRSDLAIRAAVDSLAELTHNMGFATIGAQLYISGMSQLFDQPEFVDPERMRAVARLLDKLEPWLRDLKPDQPVSIFIGSESPIARDSDSSLIVSRFRSPLSETSYIGVLGSTRQSYAQVIRLVGQTGRMLEGLLGSSNNLLED